MTIISLPVVDRAVGLKAMFKGLTPFLRDI